MHAKHHLMDRQYRKFGQRLCTWTKRFIELYFEDSAVKITAIPQQVTSLY